MMAMAAMVWMRPSAVLVVGGAIVLLAPLAILPAAACDAGDHVASHVYGAAWDIAR